MQDRPRDRSNTKYEDTIPMQDLLRKQRKGKFLNHREKTRILQYAESRRKENKNKR